MPEKTLTVVAQIKAKQGAEEEVRQILLSLIEPTHQEPGCVDYTMHQGTEDKSLFMFYENWTSKEALEEHIQKPHLQAFLARAEELLDGPLDVSFWEKAGE